MHKMEGWGPCWYLRQIKYGCGRFIVNPENVYLYIAISSTIFGLYWGLVKQGLTIMIVSFGIYRSRRGKQKLQLIRVTKNRV